MEPDYDSVIKRLDAAFDKANFPNSSTSNINVSMGGGSIAVWFCATCCVVSLLACIFIAREVSEIRQNDRDQGNQLNAIYVMAPNIKPEKKP